MLTILNNTIFNYIIFNVNNYCKFLIFRNKVYYNIVFLSRWGKNAMNKYTLSLIFIKNKFLSSLTTNVKNIINLKFNCII